MPEKNIGLKDIKSIADATLFWVGSAVLLPILLCGPGYVAYQFKDKSKPEEYDWKVNVIDDSGTIVKTHISDLKPDIDNDADQLRVTDIFTNKTHYFRLDEVTVQATLETSPQTNLTKTAAPLP